MNDYGLTEENVLNALPAVLQNDPNIYALASAVAAELVKQNESIDLIKIYSKIDLMPEALTDILAKDFKVDWWSQLMDVEEKRATLKSSWDIHRRMGTPYAVKKAISAVYQDSEIMEWFDYGGEPYHFKVLIDASYENTDTEKHKAVIQNVMYYKNVRSWMDAVEYYNEAVDVSHIVGAFVVACAVQDTCTTINGL